MHAGHGPTFDRRGFLAAAGLAWLAPAGRILAAKAERSREPARSLIVLWMGGGPSQLETFDPHPGTRIAGGTGAIVTAAKGLRLARGFEPLADRMGSVALIRSVVSKEGDHERGSYMLKTGYRPDPTVAHPSIGAIGCHELPVSGVEIPRHVAILPGQWPGRGGFLGGAFDAFQAGDPSAPLPDAVARVPSSRDAARSADLAVVERSFARGRSALVDATGHRDAVARARTMMSSEQLKAFDVSQEPSSLRAAYGNTPFGRGCLAARRLVEVGVRCVEVSLNGWDAHVNNHEIHKNQVAILAPAFAALLGDLADRGLLDRTVVLCGGEFGRTPKINLAGGRDHWPRGFSLALAGGGIRGGLAVGATDPEGLKEPTSPTPVEDVHATILTALGLDPAKENVDPATGRPIKLSEGRPIRQLLS